MKGRVVVDRGRGGSLEIQEYELPDPEPGALILKITQAGVCGSDLHAWRGERLDEFDPIPPEGRPTGHEGTGVVYRLGEGVSTDWLGKPIAEGDRIIHASLTSCGRCPQCSAGMRNLCSRRSGFPTAGVWPYFTSMFADYFYITPDRPFYAVPDELPDESLSWVNCAMGTSAQALVSAGCSLGDSVVIQGAGGLGLCAAALASYMGASPIVVLDRLPGRLELAKLFGADHVINVDEVATAEERRDVVTHLTGGVGASVVLELAGVTELIVEGVGYLAPGGTLVEVGHVMAGSTLSIDPASLLMDKRVMGSMAYNPELLPKVMDMMVKTQDRFPYHKIVSAKFNLEDINEAMAAAEWSGRQTAISRAVVTP
jgi:threonine dehydrogenase-like Zn-dependent dehydrogenase